MGEAYQVMKLLIMQSPTASRHFLPLRLKYSPQHPVHNSIDNDDDDDDDNIDN